MTTNRKHEVKKLLRLGWFVCQHENKDIQATELWYLLDPQLLGHVPKQTVMDFVRTLLAYAIEIQKLILVAKEKINMRKIEYLESL